MWFGPSFLFLMKMKVMGCSSAEEANDLSLAEIMAYVLWCVCVCVYLSLSTLQVETEVFDKIDDLLFKGKGDEEYKEMFHDM